MQDGAIVLNQVANVVESDIPVTSVRTHSFLAIPANTILLLILDIGCGAYNRSYSRPINTDLRTRPSTAVTNIHCRELLES